MLYTPEGAIDGAAAALASLRAAGKGCFFVTNNAANTRAQLLGVDVAVILSPPCAVCIELIITNEIYRVVSE